MSQSLQVLSDYAIEANKLIAEAGGELTPEIEAFLDQVTQDLSSKIDGYKTVEDELYYQADKLKELSKAIANKAKAVEATAERLRERVKFTMEKLQVTELSGHLYQYKLVNGAKKLVIDESILAPGFFIETLVVTKSVNKEEIKDLLNKNVAVPGAELVAVTYPKSGLAKQPKLKGGK